MKLRGRITLIIITILIIISSSVVTYALLIDRKEKDSIKFELGYLNYELIGNISNEHIYPGKNIVTSPYKIINNSTIETNIRIAITFYINNEEININDYVITNGFNIDQTVWTLNNDFYVYNQPISELTKEVFLFDQIILDGYKVQSNLSLKDFKIKINFQAKQKNHVTWEELGEEFLI